MSDPVDNMAATIGKEYQEFLNKLNVLKKEQERLIAEYQEKLRQRKLAQLRQQINGTE